MVPLALLLLLFAHTRASPADGVVTLTSTNALPVTSDNGQSALGRLLSSGPATFLSVTENATVLVFDATLSVAAALAADAPTRGLTASPMLSLVIAASDDGALTAWSTSPPYARAWRVDAGAGVDTVHMDNMAGLVYAAHGADGGGVSVWRVTAANATFVQDIPTGPVHPADFVLSPTSNLIFIATNNAVLVYDRTTYERVETWASSDWANPVSMRIDESGQRLWLATAGDGESVPAQLLVLNAQDGSQLWATRTTPGASCVVELYGDDGLIFALCAAPVFSQLWVAQATATSMTGVQSAWTSLGSVDAMPPAANARSIGWSKASQSLLVALPFIATASVNQSASMLVFTLSAPDSNDDDDSGGTAAPSGPSAAAWTGIVIGVGLVSLGVGAFLARRVCPARASVDSGDAHFIALEDARSAETLN